MKFDKKNGLKSGKMQTSSSIIKKIFKKSSVLFLWVVLFVVVEIIGLYFFSKYLSLYYPNLTVPGKNFFESWFSLNAGESIKQRVMFHINIIGYKDLICYFLLVIWLIVPILVIKVYIFLFF